MASLVSLVEVEMMRKNHRQVGIKFKASHLLMVMDPSLKDLNPCLVTSKITILLMV